jgi:hypothetical protein
MALPQQIYMVDYLGLRYGRLVIYSIPSYPNNALPPRRNHDLHSNDQPTAYSGLVSPHARKRLRKAYENLLEVSPWKTFTRPSDQQVFPFRLNFITLTLSGDQGDVTDREVHKECFEPFLQTMRRKWGVTHYVWKAEVQKRGAIHYHITTNRYIDYQAIRNEWNKLQNKLGFIDQFMARHGHRHPNSTDVHSVRDDHEIGMYMSKYMSKSGDDRRALGIKVWGCTKSLLVKENRNFEVDSAISSYLTDLKKSGEIHEIQYDHCKIIIAEKKLLLEKAPHHVQKSQDCYLGSIMAIDR